MSACKHYADLYGRCIECGKTWEQRAQESLRPASNPEHHAERYTPDVLPEHIWP